MQEDVTQDSASPETAKGPSIIGMLIPNGRGTKSYNPNRDITHAFASIALEAGRRMDDLKAWSPALVRWLKDLNVTEEDMQESVLSFLQFMNTAQEVADDGEPYTLQQALQRSGFLDKKPEANAAYMSMMGMVFVGFAFAGIQDATVFDSDPLADLKKLTLKGREAVLAQLKPNLVPRDVT